MSNLFKKKPAKKKAVTQKKKAAKVAAVKPAPVRTGHPATEYGSHVGDSAGDIKAQAVTIKDATQITVIVPNGINARDIATQLVNITDLIRFR